MFDRLRVAAANLLTRGTIYSADPIVGGAHFGYGHPTVAGPSVSERNALGITAIWRAVKLYADTIAALSFYTAERDARGGKRPAKGHWSYGLVHDYPDLNLATTSFSFRQSLVGHALTYGNGYAQIVWNPGGMSARSMHLLDPRDVTPERSDDGSIGYRYEPTGETIYPEDIIHIHGFGFDGVSGYSPISIARESLGLAVAKGQWESSIYSNSARPGGHVEVPGKMDSVQRKEFLASWKEVHQGSLKSNEVGLLTGGAKWVQTSFSPADAELILSRNFSIGEIARLYCIPPHMLGLMEGATVGNMEEQAIQFLQFSLLPWLKMIESEFDSKLFDAEERKRYFTRHDFDSLMRGNSTARVAFHRGMFNIGCMTINEIRANEGMNPVDRKEFDLHFIAANNMAPVEGIVERLEAQAAAKIEPSGQPVAGPGDEVPDTDPENPEIPAQRGVNGYSHGH